MNSIGPLALTLLLFSAISFLFFGVTCLYSPYMMLEFKRYGLSKYRKLTGILQLAGALALLIGLWFLPLALLGSMGLSMLMVLGFITRIRIKDSFLKSTPSLFYALVNLALFFVLFNE
ncbi:DoxX-like family protein [Robiginitalea myxolifaciens]|uniref:DoxX-like family protein n=1 Tax=Robiginitalea myxolifaciens TaxID=400055 RepID=A0A1I6H1A8_9FLAO|nr:DoxX family protein [Robiginitalea myxolifaciens]SFR48245.1 DoxX-like family protein [Robiginitalea myxolifaciens]